MKTYSFNGISCYPEFHAYANGRTALIFKIRDSGEPLFIATTNLPDLPLGGDEVFIKTWSENHQVLPFLESAGFVSRISEHPLAHDSIAIKCKLLKGAPDVLDS